MIRRFVFAIACIMASYYCYAQTDSLQQQLLDEVVVTGQYAPQSVKNSVYQTRIISRGRIIRQGATRLQDVLANELNIKFSQDLATGGSNIELMGLSGQNVKIMVDGVPLIGRQGTSNEININQVDINSIERVEIVEGPMSVIYGADALAGVINIITKKNLKEISYVRARIQEESAGNEYGIDQGLHYQSAEAGWSNKHWKLNGGVSRNYFGGWKGYSTGREMDWHKKDQLAGNIFAGYHFGNNNIHYRFDALHELITNPGAFGGNEAIDQDYITRRAMHQLQSAFQLRNNLSMNLVLSHTRYEREIYSTVLKKDGTRTLALGSGMQDLTRFKGNVARGTLLYVLSSLVSIQPGFDINLESASGERLKKGEQRINDFALFVTSEIIPVKGWKVRPGVRFIKNSVYDAPPAVPALNTLVAITPSLNLRLAYANGFRSPSIRELYFYFFDANHQIAGNTDLKAETSNSVTGSVEWTAVKKNKLSFTSSVSAFYNDVKNLIGIGQSAADPTVFTYINVNRYKTRGVNISNKLAAGKLQATLGASYTGRFNALSETYKDVPGFKWSFEGNGSLSYMFAKPAVSVSAYYKYTGKLPGYQLAENNGQQEVVLAETADYHWMDVAASKKIHAFTINIGIRNVFNVKRINSTIAGGGAHSESGPRPVAYGRSLFAGISYEWNKKIHK